MRIVDVARICHEANRALCLSQGDLSQVPFDEAPEWQRQSAINGVDYHLAHPDSTPADSHTSWLAEKTNTGWVYGPVKDADAKTHPCCVPFDALPPEQRVKDSIFLGIVRACEPFLSASPSSRLK